MYVDNSHVLQPGPWVTYRNMIRAVEVCKVEDLKYSTHPGSGESCCHITLKFIDPSCRVVGQKFKFTLPELDVIPDFLVETARYDAAMERNWMTGDKCVAWWRNPRLKEGGAWWDGRISEIKDRSSNFPGSPWEKFIVKYKNDDEDYHHSPWELHDPERIQEQPKIDSKSKEKILNSLTKLLRTATENKVFFFLSNSICIFV